MKKIKHKKKLAALLLAIAVIIQGLPLTAFASTTEINSEAIILELEETAEELLELEEALQLETEEPTESEAVSEVAKEETTIEENSQEETAQTEDVSIENEISEQTESQPTIDTVETAETEVVSEEVSRSENTEVSAEEVKPEEKTEVEILTLTVDENGTLLYGGAPLYVGRGDEKIPANIDALLQKGVAQRLTRANGEAAALQYHGTVTYGLSTVGNFTVNGQQAFCLQHPKATPGTGTPNSGLYPYDNINIQRILYYGWGGPGNIFGSDQARGIVVTSLVLSKYYNGDISGASIPGWSQLDNLAQSGSVPDNKIQLNGTNSTVNLNVSISGGKQVSSTATLNADKDNHILINIPAGITFINETTGETATNRSVGLYGGQKFHLEAALNYTGSFSSGELSGFVKAFQPLVVKFTNSNYQDVGLGRPFTDPAQVVSFTANFKTTDGYLQIVKTSDDGFLLWNDFETTDNLGNSIKQSTLASGKTNILPLPVYDSNGNKIQYQCKEIGTNNRYNQPPTQSFTLNPGETVTLNFHNGLKKSDVTIKKTSENGIVAGFEFELTGNGLTQTGKTDSNGEFTFTNLVIYDSNNQKISYTMKEINVPNEYVDPQAQTFTLEENQTVELSFYNALKYGELEIIKTSEDGNVAGISFNISGNGLNQTVTTGTDGKFKDTNILPGVYTVTENTPSQYVPQQSQQVTVIAGQTATITFNNVLARGSVMLKKLDAETHNLLSGAEFEVYEDTNKTGVFDINSKFVGMMSEVSAGVHQLTGLTIGGYFVKEKTAPQDYIKDENVYYFEIDFNGEIVTIENEINVGFINWHLPEIQTTAVNHEDDSKIFDPLETVTIKDTVTYSHLIPGKEYTVKGVLMDKETGLPLLVNGDTVTAEETFLAPSENGSIDILFTFSAVNLRGKTVVVFEEVYKDDVLLTVHADIEDKGQTVTFTDPEIKTTAVNHEDDSKVFDPLEKVILKDTVHFENLITGKEYTIKGLLMDKETGLSLLVNGEEVRAETTFTAPSESGSADVFFFFNAVDLRGKTVVVFEELYRDDVLIAVHADIDDEGQTVTFTDPEIKTTAVNHEDDSKLFDPLEKVILKDTVDFENLITGKEYTIKGLLMDKETGLPLLVNGEEVRAETTFTAPSESGSADVFFFFNAVDLRGKTVVVFEELYRDDVLIAVHADIDDEGQTVEFTDPEIKTTATIDGEKEAVTKEKITIVDVVEYKNLIPGKEYLVVGVVKDKATGKDFEVNGKNIIVEKIFVPETSSGTIEIEFTFEALHITEETDLVIFEDVFRDGILLAVHADINDLGQTVKIKPLKGKIITTKVNADDPSDKLSGAIFDVYTDVDGDGKYTEGVDTLFGTLTETEFGVYELDELLYGKYLFNERTAPKGFVRDPIYYAFEITQDGQIVKFETIPGADFPNKPIKGTVMTTKVNADDPSDKLSGAVFEVYIDVDGDGKYTAGTDTLRGTLSEIQKGVYQLEELRAGKYLIHEKTAPKGFIRDKNYYPFEITDDGQIVKFETIPGADFPNRPEPKVPSVKTGDNSNMLGFAAAGTLSAVFFFVLTFKRKKKATK